MSRIRKGFNAVGEVVADWLSESGLAARVEQAAVVPDWSALVGPQIAAVTWPVSVQADGTLVVQVSTHAWMTELSLLEPELLRSLNGRGSAGTRSRIRRIRWQLRG